ncbi:MAG: hypothetical protein DSO00_05210 [Archaeoglobi archaeon]|nr:MAG: hypothetical protein DSO00_05210 [Archaeoglobi archaeon]
MRRLIAIIALIALICQAEARHERFSAAEQSDEWIHEFFSIFLKEFETSLRDMAKSEIRINETEKIRETLEIVSGEIEFYRKRGVESNASLAINPFLEFSRNLNALSSAQVEFLEGMRNLKEKKGNYFQVASAIAKARNSMAEMRKNLDEIDSIVLYKNSTALKFNTSGVRDALGDVEKIFETYESIAKAYEADGIWVLVSKQSPVLFENVTIWIYAKNVAPKSLFIDGIRLEPKETVYSFETVGKHFLYAEGLKGSEVVKSEVVEVDVKKIPTYIFLNANSAFVGNEAEVDGLVQDYYGRKMSAPLRVLIDGSEQLLESDDGFFSLKIRRNWECSVKVEVFYEGNATHEGAYARETVHFLRFPVWIRLESDRERVAVGENVSFIGIASDELPLEIIVNSERKLQLAGRNFSFSMNFPTAGKYEIYARFPGDELRRPAESNRIEISVFEPYWKSLTEINFQFLALFLALLASAFAAGIFGREKKLEAAFEEKKKEETRTELPENSFENIFNSLVEKFGLKRGLTPRELLKKMESQPFYGKLKEVVELHEKFAYAGIKLSSEEEERFFRLISELMLQI